jgi:hypothetical protein
VTRSVGTFTQSSFSCDLGLRAEIHDELTPSKEEISEETLGSEVVIEPSLDERR